MDLGEGAMEDVVKSGSPTGFWNGRRVFLTGHTGFKGAWLCEWLLGLGAEVHGLALAPDTTPALFNRLELSSRLNHRLADVRDLPAVRDFVNEVRPDFVFHLAAQALVRRDVPDRPRESAGEARSHSARARCGTAARHLRPTPGSLV